MQIEEQKEEKSSQNSVANRVIKKMRDGLIKFADEDQSHGLITPVDTQIFIALKPHEETGNLVPFYRIFKNWQPYLRKKKIKKAPFYELVDEVSFKKILSVKVDFLGYEELTKMFITDCFSRMQKELSVFFEKVKKQIEAPSSNVDKEVLEFIETNKSFNIAIDEVNFGVYEYENDPKSYLPNLEIVIVTKSNDPVIPQALLYYEGVYIRNLDFTKDIFIMPE
jgi:hypothetical protein